MDATLIIVGLVALALGAVIGWLLGARGGEQGKATAESLRLQLDGVRDERDSARSAHEAAARELAALQADARNFEARLKDLQESKDALITQFRAIGDQLLEKAHKDFLDKAGERFSEADKASQAKLQTLLQPVEATLKRYEEGLQRVEKERVDHYAGLREAVELVRAGQGQVRDETRNLVNALKSSSKTRGNWGEQSLRNVLEQAGLSPYADFRSEVSVNSEEGRLRPDVVVRLPGGGQMIIDAKISFNAYMAAHEEIDDARRAAHLQSHLTSIKNHVNQLSSKKYWDQFDGTAELVVMYVAGEHFLNAALELEPGLWQWANEKRVLLATPTNLVALARTAASYWKQDNLNKEAREIASLGKELHSRLATMAQHMERVGKNLSTANAAYNQMVGSFESQVFTQARRFETLGAGSAKEVPTPPMVEASPRPLTKLAGPKPSANEDDAAA